MANHSTTRAITQGRVYSVSVFTSSQRMTPSFSMAYITRKKAYTTPRMMQGKRKSNNRLLLLLRTCWVYIPTYFMRTLPPLG